MTPLRPLDVGQATCWIVVPEFTTCEEFVQGWLEELTRKAPAR